MATYFETTFNNKIIKGYYYIPPEATTSSDAVLGFYGTIETDNNSVAAALSLLNGLKNTIGITDKIIVAVTYPQENVTFDDGYQVAEAALLWLKSNPVNVLGIKVNKIYLFGHSQGGYMVVRLNTAHLTDGVIASAPGPIDLIKRCQPEEAKPLAQRRRECALFFNTYGSVTTAPQAYLNQSLISFTTGSKAKTLYIQGLGDSAFQLNRFNEFKTLLNQCTNCAPYTILEIPAPAGHNAFAETPIGRQAVRNFLKESTPTSNDNTNKIVCSTNIDIIFDDEYIGDSLPKINNNFAKLEALTNSIRNEINISKNVRTFFYYGPNAPAGDNGTSGMNNNNTSRPSNTTIQNFVNNSLGLNSPTLSKNGDIAYVIYQKTGWYNPDPLTYTQSGTGTVTFSKQETYTVAVTRRIGIAGKCFAAGTKIKTPNGIKAIEDIIVGDEVVCFDPITFDRYISKVTKIFKNSWEQNHQTSPLLKIVHENGVLNVVEGHWLYQDINDKQKYKKAKDFKKDDCLYLENGTKSKIISIEQNQKYDWVYNISTNQYHNFIADNILVGDYEVDNETILIDRNFKHQINGVLTPTGVVNKEKLKLNDKVYGYDPENLYLDLQEIQDIQSKNQPHIKITHEQGELIIPKNQKILIDGIYKQAKDLKINEELTTVENTNVYHPHFDTTSKILNIEQIDDQIATELQISNTHNYILDGVYVHNGGGGGYVTTYETRVRTIYQDAGYSWTANISDTYNNYAPVFVIYKLVYNGSQYTIESGFPKYSYATTGSTTNWNNPQSWYTY